MRISLPSTRLVLGVFALAALALGACVTPPPPQAQTQPQSVEVTREVPVTVVVTVEVEKIVEVTPEPEPPPPPPPAYEPDAEILVSGLSQPRQLVYADDGTLFIAEVGRAGDAPVVVDPENTVHAGLTSRISALSSDGELSVAVPALPSIEFSPGNTGLRGAQGIAVTDDSYWIAIGEAPSGLPGLTYFRQVIQVDRATLRPGIILDTAAAARAAGQPDPDAVNSDPSDLAVADDGTLFIVDSGCNCLWTWTADAGLNLFHGWDIDDNPVPTGISFGPDGNVYISFLSGFPFDEGSARIEQWTREGELVQTYGGLTLATDVLVTSDGTIYAVQLAAGLGDRGFIPDSGSVVMVTAEGVTPVMEGLRSPYGLAQAPDGSLVVSLVSAFDMAGNGMVVKVPMP